MDIGLDHAVIHVSDRERSNAFHRDVIGAEVPRGGARRPGTSVCFRDRAPRAKRVVGSLLELISY